MKFSVVDFFSKCDQIRRKLRIWPHLLKKLKWKTLFFVQCNSKSPTKITPTITVTKHSNIKYIQCVKSIQIRVFFLVSIFPHSQWIRRDIPYLSVFNPNAGKYGPEKTPYLDTFRTVIPLNKLILFRRKWCTLIFSGLRETFFIQINYGKYHVPPLIACTGHI